MIWIVLATIGTLVGAWYRPVSADEAWSLVVARRMNRGERLYRDIFYGAAPLAIWLQALAFRVTRPQGWVVRSQTVAYAVAEIAACIVLVGADTAAGAAVAGIVLAFGGVHLAAHNHYGHLSTTATLWAAVAVEHGRPVLAGCLVGIAVLGRYSVGVLAAGALGIHVWLVAGWGDALGLVVSASLPVVVALLVRPRAVPWFFRRAVANKPTYVATGGVNPLTWVRRRSWKRLDLGVISAAMTAAMLVVVAAPPLALTAVVADRASVVLALALVGASVVYPRFDGHHAVAAVPLAAPALVVGVPDEVWLWPIGVTAWSAAVLGLVARRSLTGRARIRRDLPSLRYLPVAPLAGGVWPDETDELPAEVFVLRLDAAFVYACGGVTNPTPFDYPAASTFGATGEREVLDAFGQGLPVCDGWRRRSDPLAPRGLLDALPPVGGRQTRLGRLVELSP